MGTTFNDRLWHAKNKLRRIGTHASRRMHGRPRIIASLTSYPPRINTVHLAINSLLSQETLPDRIVLYLYEGEFPNRIDDLPDSLTSILSSDVVVRWVDDNLKPHKKYFYALQDYPDDIVITFDDDLIYRPSIISELIGSYYKFPHAVSAERTHLIMFDSDGGFLPYAQWVHGAPIWLDELLGVPTFQLLGTNGAGTLFPPHIMPEETFDKEAIIRTCLTADDLWIKGAQLYADVPVVAVTSNQYIEYIPHTQESALYHFNLDGGGNDQIWVDVLEHFQQLSKVDLSHRAYDTSLHYDLLKVPPEYRPH